MTYSGEVYTDEPEIFLDIDDAQRYQQALEDTLACPSPDNSLVKEFSAENKPQSSSMVGDAQSAMAISQPADRSNLSISHGQEAVGMEAMTANVTESTPVSKTA